jgi:hypothetical protein
MVGYFSQNIYSKYFRILIHSFSLFLLLCMGSWLKFYFNNFFYLTTNCSVRCGGRGLGERARGEGGFVVGVFIMVKQRVSLTRRISHFVLKDSFHSLCKDNKENLFVVENLWATRWYKLRTYSTVLLAFRIGRSQASELCLWSKVYLFLLLTKCISPSNLWTCSGILIYSHFFSLDLKVLKLLRNVLILNRVDRETWNRNVEEHI